MRFDREIKPYAEPISEGELKEGSIYFSVTFVDNEMLIPIVEPMVFIGKDLEPGDSGRLYFQDINSYRAGIYFHSETQDADAKFLVGSESELGHFFEYERALDVLMGCSLRRRRIQRSG